MKRLFNQRRTAYLRKINLLTLSSTVLFMHNGHAEENNNYIGVAAGYVPYYNGADRSHLIAVPQARLFNGLFVMQSKEASLALPLGSQWSTGLMLGYNGGRQSSDVSALKGLQDIDAAFLYGAFLRWQPGKFNASLKYLKSTEQDQGAQITAAVNYDIYQQPDHTVSLGIAAVWSDDDYMQTWYGITQQQQRDSERHYSVYHPDAGISQIIPNLRWEYNLNENWRINGLLAYSRLTGDAEQSPLSEDNGNVQALVGISYRF